MKNSKYKSDYLILGGGIYGCYAAKRLLEKYSDINVILLEYDSALFTRASFVNQARVHNGYHYPRSLYTALKSASYYDRFNKEYAFALNQKFEKIYAISKNFSYTSPQNFESFCKAANIPLKPIHPSLFFKEQQILSAYVAEEFSMDAQRIHDYYLKLFENEPRIQVLYNNRIKEIELNKNDYKLINQQGGEFISPFIINTSYASINQINQFFGHDKFAIKYELAEVCLVHVSEAARYAGITVMDGAFFSLMPFGQTNFHSLTAVNFTPHKISQEELPTFNCQLRNLNCTPKQLDNCNTCQAKPLSSFVEMQKLAQKYLNDGFKITYNHSLYAIKAILQESELSDSRPTLIKTSHQNPHFISVLSGNFNTIYDLDEVL